MHIGSAKHRLVVGVGLGVLLCLVGSAASASTSGQFLAYFGEATSSEEGPFHYLACYSVMQTPPKVWVVDLDGGPSAQPVEYKPFTNSDPDSIWPAWSRLTNLKGKRTELRSEEDWELRIRLRADSAGVDTLCRTTRYSGLLIAETQGGKGVIGFTMFCDTLIEIRGLYRLPGRRERVAFIAYKGSSCGCDDACLPVIIYPE